MEKLVDLTDINDIEKLECGNVIMAKFDKEEVFLVYDGKKDGLYQFLDYFGGEPHSVICNWRVNREILRVRDGYLSGFDLWNSLNQTYEPGDKDFENKKRILENAGVI